MSIINILDPALADVIFLPSLSKLLSCWLYFVPVLLFSPYIVLIPFKVGCYEKWFWFFVLYCFSVVNTWFYSSYLFAF